MALFQQSSKQREDIPSSKMAERKDMLILAQQKLDEVNRSNLGLSIGGGCGRPDSAQSKRRRKYSTSNDRGSAISPHLLSTLLYMSLMIHKVEDMKAMLQEEDPLVYDEWRSLLESLHSPEFHARERILQNQRVKGTFERKRRYKEETLGLREQLDDTSNQLSNLQKLSNETSHQLSKSINVLQDERAVLVSNDEEKQYQIDELDEKIHELKVEAEKKKMSKDALENEVKRREEAIDKLNEQLEQKDQSIKRLEGELSQTQQEFAVANEKAVTAVVSLEDSETKFANYRLEKESTICKMQQEIVEAESQRASVNAKLAATNESLNDVKRELEENRKVIEAKIDSFWVATRTSLDEMKTDSTNLNEMTGGIHGGISKLDERITKTESLIKEINERHKVANEQASLWIEKSQMSLDKTAEICIKVTEENDTLKKVISYEKCVQDALASLEKGTSQIQMALSSSQQRMDEFVSKVPERYTAVQESLELLERGTTRIQLALSSSQHQVDEIANKVPEICITDIQPVVKNTLGDGYDTKFMGAPHEIEFERTLSNSSASVMDESLVIDSNRMMMMMMGTDADKLIQTENEVPKIAPHEPTLNENAMTYHNSRSISDELVQRFMSEAVAIVM